MSNSSLNPAAHEWRPSAPPPFPHLVFGTVHYFLPPPPPPLIQPQPPHALRWASGRTINIPPRMRRPPNNPPPPPPPKNKGKGVWIVKETNASPDATTSKTDKPFTTLMIKNIPYKLRRGFMLDFLDEYCRHHTLEYDFLYLPMDFRTNHNLGYAFVNLTTAKAAHDLERILNNFKWKQVEPTSNKICKIAWAEFQGKEALVEKFRKSIFKCDWEEFLPVILEPPHNG